VQAEEEEEEDAAQRAHWANALAEGPARRAADEYCSQRALQREQAERLELTPREQRRLANLRRREIWGSAHTRGAGPSGAGNSAGSRASDYE
jgi:hypothetical protein